MVMGPVLGPHAREVHGIGWCGCGAGCDDHAGVAERMIDLVTSGTHKLCDGRAGGGSVGPNVSHAAQEYLSASTTGGSLGLVKDPTAVHAVAVVHDTPFSVPLGAAGVVWIVQVVASHSSARVPAPAVPTAEQDRSVAHETAESRPLLSVGVAACWIVQLVPFQNSASAAGIGLVEKPTAVHDVADVHETPSKELFGTAGVVWIVQLVPSQNSASGASGPPLGTEGPVAVHAVAEAHETAASLLFALAGLEVV
jgi:hypothetical protein